MSNNLTFVTKVEYATEDGGLDWAFLALDSADEPTLVQSIIGLFNKNMQMFDNASKAIQLAKDCGFPKIKLITFNSGEGDKPYLESEIWLN